MATATKSQQARLPEKPEGVLWPPFLDGYSDLVKAYYWGFGLKSTASFAGCSESTLLKAIDSWDAREPDFAFKLDDGTPLVIESMEDQPNKPALEQDRVTAPSGHVHPRGDTNLSAQYWRGRHDGFREGVLMGLDLASGMVAHRVAQKPDPSN